MGGGRCSRPPPPVLNMLKANDLQGAAKKYESLPSYEKEQIDRKVDSMTAEIERHEESKVKDGKSMIQSLSKELAGYAYGYVLNGGHLNVPDTKFRDDGSEIRCNWCRCVRGAVYRKGKGWYCEFCKDEVEGPIEDTFINYKR